MRNGLRGDRATSAVPVSLAARVSAWAKESLVARAMAIAAGLVVLAVIGGSALAGGAKIGAGVAEGLGASPSTSLADAGVVGVMPAADVASAVSMATVAAPSSEGATTSPSIERQAAAPGAGGAKQRASPDDPVDLNAATADDLRRLPGVGAKRAEAILALRARLPGGRFKQIEDLLKVKGIGRAMLRRLHPLVRLATPIADAGGPRA